MPWITFDKDHDWAPAAARGMVTTAFKAGQTVLATKEAAALAIGKGVAREATEAEIKNARRKS